jgi:branched-subunit amino acid ABC-type transport system permease component
MAEFLQFAFSGLTVGAVYALVALGFTLIYNASGVVNFAQGEFVMLGGMSTVFLALAGVPLLQNVLWAKRLYWVLDIDIRKYFDSIPHSHLRAFLDQRVTDGVIRRTIDKWLKAGVGARLARA